MIHYPYGAVASTAEQAQFSPSNISGLNTLLLPSNYTIDTTLSTNTCASWNDTSGNNNHCTQTTKANQPLVVTNILNGQTVLRFDGIDDWLDLANGMMSVVGNAHTTYLVYVLRNIDATEENILAVRDSANNSGLNHWRSATPTSGVTYRTTVPSSAFPNNGQTMTNNQIVMFRASKDGLDLSVNIRSSANNYNQSFTNALTWTNGTGHLGRLQSGVPQRYAQVDIAELVQYNRSLTVGEITQVDTYLNQKYLIW